MTDTRADFQALSHAHYGRSELQISEDDAEVAAARAIQMYQLVIQDPRWATYEKDITAMVNDVMANAAKRGLI